MPDYPAHASPAFPPQSSSSRPDYHERKLSDFHLSHDSDDANISARQPPPLVSPPATPRTFDLASDTSLDTTAPPPLVTPPASTSQEPELDSSTPELLPTLPTVTCEVRARIPTTAGQEMFLHLYSNSADNKEHLAIVFGPHIRSRSLDAQRPGETEKDRMIRGAYTGTLYPGRTSSRLDQIRREAGVATPTSPSPQRTARRGSGDSGSSEGTGSGAVSGSGTGPASSQVSTSGVDGFNLTEHNLATHDLAAPLVRIHSECYTGETVWSARCDCGEQLDEAARLMAVPPSPSTLSPSAGGVIIYLRQEGRGIGLLSKLKAYNLQDLGHDTMQANLLLRHPADARSYGLATAMLLDLGLGGERGIRLLTNNPEKVRAVEGPNREVRVVQRVGMVPLAWSSGGKEGVRGPEVEKYISTKIEKFKHMFSS